ncbi:hypothetical protein [Actinoallomurus sp. CA-150999]|uniref:hypothetical protein n=1 Tax=Actinoallomurus sp. CA-150999 TaxID=3239887 RepID=UPI003D900901
MSITFAEVIFDGAAADLGTDQAHERIDGHRCAETAITVTAHLPKGDECCQATGRPTC